MVEPPPNSFFEAPERRRGAVFICTILLIAAAWLYLPFVSSGLPYLYNEDEAHHLNRTLNMVKRGEFNPRYFHKPSLHFYLRMPFTAAGFLWNVRRGDIRSLKEINTQDQFGIGGYAFSVSHAGIAKWVRGASVLFTMALIICTFLLAYELTSSLAAATTSAVLVAASPAIVENSALVGVDILTAFLAVLAALLSVRAFEHLSVGSLLIAGLAAGLTVSSKYNALPIVLLPLAVVLLHGQLTPRYYAAALAAPVCGFILGSPFLFASLPLFLDQLAYEIWHYGIAGHEGHTAEPGLEQLLFYARWFRYEALGLVAAVSALAGVVIMLVRPTRKQILFLLFPALFIALMASQRVNFPRNMLPAIPFAAVAAAAALYLPLKRSLAGHAGCLALVALISIPAALPTLQSLRKRVAASTITESRKEATSWIKANHIKQLPLAIDGNLQFEQQVYALPGVDAYDPANRDVRELFLNGFSYLLVGPKAANRLQNRELLEPVVSFAGANESQRIVQNPAMDVYRFKDNLLPALQLTKEEQQDLRSLAPVLFAAGSTSREAPAPICNPGEPTQTQREEHCWLTTRVAMLRIQPVISASAAVRVEGVTLEVMSPWPQQDIILSYGGREVGATFEDGEEGAWKQLELPLITPRVLEGFFIEVRLSEVRSPFKQGLSEDRRRLGIAVRKAALVVGKVSEINSQETLSK